MIRPLALICAVALIFVCNISLHAATTTTTSPTTAAAARDPRIGEMYDYYATLYAQPLNQKDRLARLVGIVSLSRIDGPPLTRALLGVLKDDDLVVGQFAWEGLHARQASLVDRDRTAWLDGGMDLARRGAFPGATAAPLLAALIERQPGTLSGINEFLERVAEENDPATTGGRAALDAGSKTIAVWQDTKILQALVARMAAKPRFTSRLARLLSGLPDAPAVKDADAAAVRSAWSKYAQHAKFAPPTTLPAYTGFSAVLPKAGAIKDVFGKKWHKELELPKLKIDSVEIAFCVDATPSMAVSNPYVATYIQTVAQLFNLLSYNVRCGAVYYRHEIDPELMDACCKRWQNFEGDFAVKVMPLESAGDLVAKMREMKIGGRGTGHSGNGAYVAGIETAMRGMAWTAKSKRVIALTGDAKPTPNTAKALVDIATKAKADGYTLIFIERDRYAAAAVDDASRAALGMSPILYGDDIKKLQGDANSDAFAAIAEFHDTAFEQMAARVLQQSLPEPYRDRAAALMKMMVGLLQAKAAAAHAAAVAKG